MCLIVSDPDWEAKFGAVKKGKEEGELQEPPALQQLWTFSCELNQGHSVTSMAWNRKNLVRRMTHTSCRPSFA